MIKLCLSAKERIFVLSLLLPTIVLSDGFIAFVCLFVLVIEPIVRFIVENKMKLGNNKREAYILWLNFILGLNVIFFCL